MDYSELWQTQEPPLWEQLLHVESSMTPAEGTPHPELLTLHADCNVGIDALPSIFQTDSLNSDGE